MSNFVAACAHHNMSKGAKIPTRFATRRIESRRKGYFPAGSPVGAGERISRKPAKAVIA